MIASRKNKKGIDYRNGGVKTNDERMAVLERRIKELETCCEKLKACVDDLDKRKADRVSDRPLIYIEPVKVPRFEGSELR